jgi:hypothetical protein
MKTNVLKTDAVRLMDAISLIFLTNANLLMLAMNPAVILKKDVFLQTYPMNVITMISATIMLVMMK